MNQEYWYSVMLNMNNSLKFVVPFSLTVLIISLVFLIAAMEDGNITCQTKKAVSKVAMVSGIFVAYSFLVFIFTLPTDLLKKRLEVQEIKEVNVCK